ncbi:uncharacterized protein METZ01_LOCUS483613, partial [marine metagenome]
PLFGESPVCIFLNTRGDRRYRTHQLLDLIFNTISPDMLIVRSEKLPTQFQNYKDKYPKIKILQLPYESSIQEMVREFSRLDGYYIVAIGNMVGWGEQFIQELKKYRI